MRNFKVLDQAVEEPTTGLLTFTAHADDPTEPQLTLKREGDYVAISAVYGPIEIAIRPRASELTRSLSHLQAVEGLQTSRQVGSGQVFIALGLQPDGALILRPTLIADASGHITFNFELVPSAAATLTRWLDA